MTGSSQREKNCNQPPVFVYVAFYDSTIYIFLVQKIPRIEQAFWGYLLHSRDWDLDMIYAENKKV